MIENMNKIVFFRKAMLLCFITLLSMQYSFCQHRVVVSIPFKIDSYIIDKKYQLALDTLAVKCNQHKNFHVKIFGFTDTTGSEDYNDKLSRKRADAVYNYLNARTSLNEKNTYSDAQGESEERYDLHFKEAHVQQRFVDILLQF